MLRKTLQELRGIARDPLLLLLIVAIMAALVVFVVVPVVRVLLVSFQTPDGFTRRTVVPPDFRSFAAGLQRGARVAVTMTDAVAVAVTETPAA